MSERILIDKIKSLRQLEEDDPVVETLIENMAKFGQRVPILVIPSGSDFELVDGLRRLEALRAMDEKYADVVVATELQQALENLEQAHLDPPDRIRRVWEIRQAIDHLVEDYNAQIRRRPRPVDGRRVVAKAERLRGQFARAFGGLRSLDKILVAYRAAERGSPEARRIVARMEKYNIRSPYTKTIRKKGREKFAGSITGPKAQLDLLEALVRSINNSVSAAWKLGPPKLSPEELKKFTRQLSVSRHQMSKIIRLLEEAANGQQG
jgi:DNA topoisomerase VI subunit B